jgi:hypothetical protein
LVIIEYDVLDPRGDDADIGTGNETETVPGQRIIPLDGQWQLGRNPRGPRERRPVDNAQIMQHASNFNFYLEEVDP